MVVGTSEIGHWAYWLFHLIYCVIEQNAIGFTSCVQKGSMFKLVTNHVPPGIVANDNTEDQKCLISEKYFISSALTFYNWQESLLSVWVFEGVHQIKHTHAYVPVI